MTRILIAGGYGLVGGAVARHLRAAGHAVDLVLGGRNPAAGAALATDLGATCARLDVTAPGADLAAIGPVDLIIAALKDEGDALVTAAMRAGVAHIGVTRTSDSIAPSAFAAVQSPPIRPLVLAGHWQAGVMTLAALHAALAFESVERIDASALYDPADPIGPMTAGDSQGFFGRALIRRDGAWVQVDPTAEARTLSGLEGEAFQAMPMGVLDTPSLAAATGAANVRFDLGMGRSRGTSSGAVASHDIQVDLEGVSKDGRRARRRLILSDPKGQAHLTALGVLILAERVLGLDGAAPAPGGLHLPETLMAPHQAMARLAAFGVQIDMRDLV
jgi:hypothetical protein